MANKKFTELDNLATPAGADIMAIVDDVAGTPTTKKVTATNLMSLAPVQSVNGDTGAVTVSGLSLSTTSPTASGTPLAYTLTSAEDGKVVLFNESNTVYVTVPTGLGSGFNCKFVQLGAGQIVLQAGSGATVSAYTPSASELNTTIGQYAEIELVPVGTDSFVVVGNAAAPPFLNTYSLSLDGTDDYAELGTLSTFTSASTFSTSLWFKGTSIDANDTAFGGRKHYYRPNGSSGFMFTVNNVSTTFGSTPYNDGNWHQAVVTYNSGAVTCYVDGSSIGTASYASTTDSDAGNFFKIGTFSDASGNPRSANHYTGNVDEIGVWNSVLGASEVSEIYASGTVIDLSADTGNYTSSSSLQHWWRCGDDNAGSGIILTDAQGSVNGTLNNGASFEVDTP
jgi:hypothetical protein